MAKYSKKTVERIVGLVKSDTYTIAEICRQSGIAQRTYYKWLEDYPDFAAAIEEAEAERMQMMAIEAKKSLLRKLQGYEVVETHVTTVPDKDGKPKIKEQKTIKKHVAKRYGGNYIHLDQRRPGTLAQQAIHRGNGQGWQKTFSQTKLMKNWTMKLKN